MEEQREQMGVGRENTKETKTTPLLLHDLTLYQVSVAPFSSASSELYLS